MPAGNRTGPWGLGPRTGRGLGYCSGYQAPGFLFPGPGLGFGRGFGRGRGFRFSRPRSFWEYSSPPIAPYKYPSGGAPYSPYWPPFAPPNREEEQAMLEEQAKILEEQLKQISARLKEIKKAVKEKNNEK